MLLQGIIAGIVFLVFATIFLSVGGPGAGGLVALLAIFVVIGFGLTVAWAHRAMDDYRGSPFPGLLGILGVEIIPDEEMDPEPGTKRPERYWIPGASAFSSASSSARAPSAMGAKVPSAVRRGCRKCGGVTDGSDSKYCRLCGTPFDS